MPYADKDLLIADYIPEAKSNAEKDAIGRILDSVSVFVDTYCKRVPGYFNPSPAEPTIKRVRGEGEHFLRLPVHVFDSITEINGKSFESLSTSIYESEKNGWLYFETEEFGNESSFSDLPFECRRWTQNAVFKIKARWGYEVTPLDVQEAVRLTVLRVWETQKGTLGQITPGAFVVERAMAPLAKEILDRYKRREFEI